MGVVSAGSFSFPNRQPKKHETRNQTQNLIEKSEVKTRTWRRGYWPKSWEKLSNRRTHNQSRRDNWCELGRQEVGIEQKLERSFCMLFFLTETLLMGLRGRRRKRVEKKKWHCGGLVLRRMWLCIGLKK